MSEIAKGKPWKISQDAAASAIFAFARAAREGAARINLRMIAEALFNSAQEPTFAPDEFRRHANSLAGLSHDEVLVLAAFLRAKKQLTLLPGAFTDAPAVRDVTNDASLVWGAVLNREATGLPTDVDVVAVSAALGRTGWIAPLSAFGNLNFYTTRIFDTIERLVDFEAAKLGL